LLTCPRYPNDAAIGSPKLADNDWNPFHNTGELAMIPELVWQADRNWLGNSTGVSGTELALRIGFFREQWEIAGPGWLGLIDAVIGGDQIQASAQKTAKPAATPGGLSSTARTTTPVTVWCRTPDRGPGAGLIDRDHCWCVAVLHDVDPAVPETWRLTWILAAALLLRATGTSSGGPEQMTETLEHAARLTLQTGRELGLIPVDEAVVERARKLWGLTPPAETLPANPRRIPPTASQPLRPT
jgi:hypothetical protein